MTRTLPNGCPAPVGMRARTLDRDVDDGSVIWKNEVARAPTLVVRNLDT